MNKQSIQSSLRKIKDLNAGLNFEKKLEKTSNRYENYLYLLGSVIFAYIVACVFIGNPNTKTNDELTRAFFRFNRDNPDIGFTISAYPDRESPNMFNAPSFYISFGRYILNYYGDGIHEFRDFDDETIEFADYSNMSQIVQASSRYEQFELSFIQRLNRIDEIMSQQYSEIKLIEIRFNDQYPEPYLSTTPNGLTAIIKYQSVSFSIYENSAGEILVRSLPVQLEIPEELRNRFINYYNNLRSLEIVDNELEEFYQEVGRLIDEILEIRGNSNQELALR